MTDKEKIHKILSSLWKQDDGTESKEREVFNEALQAVQTTYDSFSEEPVSEDLDSFAIKYAQDKPYPVTVCQAVKVGANWQKEQLLANTADAMIGLPYENKDGGYTHLIDVSRPLPVGNNKIAIIFKED